MTSVRHIGLSLLCGTFLAACQGPNTSGNDSIEAPQSAAQTTFTLANNYDLDAKVSLETNTSWAAHQKIYEHVYYDHGSGKEDQRSFTANARMSFYQSRGNESLGKNYFIATLTGQQSRDRARLGTIYNVLKSRTQSASIVRCDKPAGDQTLTCTVTPL